MQGHFVYVCCLVITKIQIATSRTCKYDETIEMVKNWLHYARASQVLFLMATPIDCRLRVRRTVD